MSALCQDFIAIDTNVFLHLLNEQENQKQHIDKLLRQLFHDRIALLVDDKKVIGNEYRDEIMPVVEKASDTDKRTTLLRYWMVFAPRDAEAVDLESDLMRSIRSVIVERKEKVDRVFVCVAFSRGRILVTNDRRHILWGKNTERPTKKRNRLTLLMKATKKYRSKGAAVLCSVDAFSSL